MRHPSPQLAISVTVGASRTQRWLACAFAALLAALAVAVATGRLGALHCPRLLALILIAGNLALVHTATNPPTARPLDVSGLGSVRGTVQQDACPSGDGLRLLPGSTLWPWLLVLRLATPGGRRMTLLVWPDSVPRSQFRPLSVALRALAARPGLEQQAGPHSSGPDHRH